MKTETQGFDCQSKQLTWSVVIPVYNITEFLKETIESVIRNNWLADDMEIIIVDNSNTETDIDSIMSSYSSVKNLRYSKNEVSLPMADNWNHCIKLAKGELVHILHSDDFIADSFYETYSQHFKEDTSLGLLCSEAHVVDAESKVIGEVKIPDFLLSKTQSIDGLLYENYLNCPSVVVRREVYNKHGNFSTNLKYCLDWEMWARAIHFCSGKGLKQKLAYYRDSGLNATLSLHKSGEHALDRVRCCQLIKQYYPAMNARKARLEAMRLAYIKYVKFLSLNDQESATNNLQAFKAIGSLDDLLLFYLKNYNLVLRIRTRLRSLFLRGR